jgi:large subunit ribosomal protein L31
MKTSIHPTYYTDVHVKCACGNSFATGSTKRNIHLDICAACHPFYTGEMKYVDIAGRVDKFNERMQTAFHKTYMKKKDKKKAKKDAEQAALKAAPQTMKEMMAQVRGEVNKAGKLTTAK